MTSITTNEIHIVITMHIKQLLLGFIYNFFRFCRMEDDFNVEMDQPNLNTHFETFQNKL